MIKINACALICLLSISAVGMDEPTLPTEEHKGTSASHETKGKEAWRKNFKEVFAEYSEFSEKYARGERDTAYGNVHPNDVNDVTEKNFSNKAMWSIGFNLSGKDFSRSKCFFSGFENIDLRKASFIQASLVGASFENADARDANFISANVTQAVFERTKLFGANFYGAFYMENGEKIPVTTDWLKAQGANFDDN